MFCMVSSYSFQKEELEQIVSESKEIDDTYHFYFDKRISAGEIDTTYGSLRDSILSHSDESHQWVPISWVY